MISFISFPSMKQTVLRWETNCFAVGNNLFPGMKQLVSWQELNETPFDEEYNSKVFVL